MIDGIPLPLLEDILANRCLPIIGSGFSQNCESLDGIMPNWNELGNEFAKKLGWKPSLHKDPLYVISYYSHEYSRTSTIENLKSILHIDTIKPGEVHHAFARLPFDTIVTTNYDYLLETAYKNVGRKHIVIADENQFSTAKINFASNESTLILKIHSDFGHPDKMVITEDDFDKYREENSLMTIYLTSLMMVRTVLFIGYSLNDPNIRPVWSIINSKLKTLRRQAYSFTARKLSSKTSKQFEMRGIKNIDIGKISQWKNVFESLGDSWQNKTSNFTPT